MLWIYCIFFLFKTQLQHITNSLLICFFQTKIYYGAFHVYAFIAFFFNVLKKSKLYHLPLCVAWYFGGHILWTMSFFVLFVHACHALFIACSLPWILLAKNPLLAHITWPWPFMHVVALVGWHCGAGWLYGGGTLSPLVTTPFFLPPPPCNHYVALLAPTWPSNLPSSSWPPPTCSQTVHSPPGPHAALEPPLSIPAPLSLLFFSPPCIY